MITSTGNRVFGLAYVGKFPIPPPNELLDPTEDAEEAARLSHLMGNRLDSPVSD